MGQDRPADESPATLERMAVRLVRLAGALIMSSRESPGEVLFKGGGYASNASPASDVDRGVELMLRDEIKRCYPRHGIIGEELEDIPSEPDQCIWILDPLDGTSNFLNGFPLFASTIGIVRDGKPIAAATWCMTTHTGSPGVYHAHEGSPLCFEHTTVQRRPSAPWRGIVSEPGRAPQYGRHWDTRVIGSAATECVLVATGVVRVASMNRPRIWDVAGGILLAQSAGCVTFVRTESQWSAFRNFGKHDGAKRLRDWRAALLIGAEHDIDFAFAANEKHSS